MGVTFDTVMGYLYNQVGEGSIRRSAILYSIDRDTRAAIERALTESKGPDPHLISSALRASGVEVPFGDIEVYLKLRDARVPFADMYQDLRDVEITLHTFIRLALHLAFGVEDWWRKGVPENIRVECVAQREKDAEPAAEPYCYTTLIQLRDILDKRWDVFSKLIGTEVAANKKTLLSALQRMNRLRNFVMHPVKGINPTESDFEEMAKISAVLQKMFQGFLDALQTRVSEGTESVVGGPVT
jgi:hypothetical protein